MWVMIRNYVQCTCEGFLGLFGFPIGKTFSDFMFFIEAKNLIRLQTLNGDFWFCWTSRRAFKMFVKRQI